MTGFDANLSPGKIISVSELNRMARHLLEQHFPLLWITGEISNFVRAASGHWYFSLKDAGAQVRCVMFKGRNSYVDFLPREGDKIEARCTITLYEARGDFQLTVEFIQRAGLGSLFEAFEQLKHKLALEGLFEESSKLPIPKLPRQIGIVTSADAAALRDVLTTLQRRMPNSPVIIYPTPVQGKGAAEQIANAINTAHSRAECDVLIICRGGGSIEDLWQFNEEIVARAIANCAIPTISGVGHETDFTICDFVADARAATPTAAAELATPSREALLNALGQLSLRLARNIQFSLHQRAQALDYMTRRLISPLQHVQQKKIHLSQVGYRLQNAINQPLEFRKNGLWRLSQNLQHLNPKAVLTRGYAFVQNKSGTIISTSKQLHSGDEICITFDKGAAEATINKTSA